MTQPEDFWDKMAVKDDRRVLAPVLTPDRTHINTINGIVKHLKTNDVILDFAYGSGVKTIDIAGNVHTIKAIDTSSKMIEVAKKELLRRILVILISKISIYLMIVSRMNHLM